ncbi:MAG: beta strand repeat-containing protein [Fluviibacter sp.]
MSDPSTSVEQNILPVQALFDAQNNFQTFIGQGQPFYASVDPAQSGLNITNSTINSTTIGATTPSSAAFTTATVATAPVGTTDVVNKQYLEYFAAGLSWKQPVLCATTANITLSGVQTLDGISAVAGSRVLVKNQTAAEENGIYISAAGAWARSDDANSWNDLISAMLFVEEGSTLAGKAFYCTAQQGGTLGTTAVNWSNFSVAASYTAGTGLTLAAQQFSITNTGVTAATYGSASSVPVVAVNAQGQITSATNTTISIANTQVTGLGTMSTQNANNVTVTGGSINGTTIGGSTAAAVTGTTITATSDFSGPGTNLSGTASGLSIGGNAATATTATKATNIAGGASGSVPYQTGANTTTFLSAGTNGQVLTLALGVPSWATPTTGTVTSVGGTGTVSGITLSGTVTTSGNLTLGGALDLSSPPSIGGTAANAITGTTVTATTKFSGTYYDASSSAGGALRTSGGTSVLQWGGGGGTNLTLDGAFNMNPSNANISIAPTGTGTLTVNPATAGTINNMAIGGTTAAAGSFTTLAASSTVSANGSVGTSGQVLTSAGAGSPAVWATPAAYATVTDDTTTNATRYLLFANQTTGNLTTEYVSSTKLKYNPSTGALTASQLIIAP